MKNYFKKSACWEFFFAKSSAKFGQEESCNSNT